jgi:hypothetical protein
MEEQCELCGRAFKDLVEYKTYFLRKLRDIEEKMEQACKAHLIDNQEELTDEEAELMVNEIKAFDPIKVQKYQEELLNLFENLLSEAPSDSNNTLPHCNPSTLTQ